MMIEPAPTSLSQIFTNVQKPVLRPWREVSLLALMVMELSWITPWYRTLTLGVAPTSLARGFAALGAILLAANLLTRALGVLRLKLSLQRAILGAGLLLSCLAALRSLLYTSSGLGLSAMPGQVLESLSDLGTPFPGEFIVLLAALLAWWRGMSLAQEIKGVRQARTGFQVGAVMLILFVLLLGPSSGETPGALLYLFLLSGLVAMGSARITILGNLRGGRPLPFDRRWLLGFLASAVLAVFLAAIVAYPAGLVGPWIVRLLAGLALGLLLLVSVPVLLVLTFLVFWILSSLELETSPIALALQDTLVRLRELMFDLGALFRGYFSFLAVLGDFWQRWAPELRMLFCGGILVLLAAVIVTRLRPGAGGRRGRLWPLNEPTEDGLDLWSELRRSLQNRLRELAALLGEWDSARRDARRAAARVRRIYARLLELGARLEAPRPPAQTPAEYLPALLELFPAQALDLHTLTLAYERVRYGELPEDPHQLGQVEAAWARVEAEGGRLLSQRKRKAASG